MRAIEPLLLVILVATTASAMRSSAATNAAKPPMTHSTIPLPDEGAFPSLDGATLWLNSAPLTPQSLRGKVVLVDFSTFTCINWLRTLPHVRAWAEKYKDHGLVVINVQTPEFEFEKNLDNVRRASKQMGVAYPTAVDNDYSDLERLQQSLLARALHHRCQGTHPPPPVWRGGYEQSEAVVKQLLAEAGQKGIGPELATIRESGAEVGADWTTLGTQETYVGSDRAENFASPGGLANGKSHVYAVPSRLELNHWALDGDWTVGKQGTVSNKANGRIVFRFHARDVHLVMGPATPGATVRFRVRIDGAPPGAAHGGDTDAEGNGTVTEQRLYQLIRQPDLIADRECRDRVSRSGRRGLRVHLRLNALLLDTQDEPRSMKTMLIILTAVLLAGVVASLGAQGREPGTRRTDLQRHDLSVPGRELIQVRVDFDPQYVSPRHTHFGEEIIYVLEGRSSITSMENRPATYKRAKCFSSQPERLIG